MFRRWTSVTNTITNLAKVEFSGDVLSVIFDFSYKHYALGDTLTELTHISCFMKEEGIKSVDIYIVIDPVKPAALTQGFIIHENYVSHLQNLLPAFTCIPGIRSLHVLRDTLQASYVITLARRAKTPIWPSFQDQINKVASYPLDHNLINKFHEKNGYVPALCSPLGYSDWAKRFCEHYFKGRRLVSINPRQSRLTPSPTVIYRDAHLNEWHDFIQQAQAERPEILFIQLGGFSEWEHNLRELKNVFVPRAAGFTLAHELALMLQSNMFIGTSSGFSTMATFTKIPYLICNIEHFFAEFAGIQIGAQSYPFAGKNQFLLWEREEASLMTAYLEKVFENLQVNETFASA